MNGASFRQSMGLLHGWGGLIAGWIGFAIFLTGSLAVFDDEITRWASPELAVTAPATPAQIIAVMRQLDARSPAYWFAAMPADRTPAMRTMWKDAKGAMERAQVDPASSRSIEPRLTGGGGFFTRFHYTLHGGDIGTWIVAAVSVAMLVAMVSGIVVHRRIFSDFFTFRPRAAAQRRWLDLHNLLAVLSLPFLLMIVYTGLTIKSRTYLPVPAGPRPTIAAPRLAKAPPAPAIAPDVANLYAKAEGIFGRGRIAFVTVRDDKDTRLFIASRVFDDRLNLSTDTATFDRASGALLGTTQVDKSAYLTQRVFAGLHFGQFGGVTVRWLYFLLGLAGTVMIGTGLILFSIKRPGRSIETITTACTTGLVLACLAHLAATRFLPIALLHREWHEAAIFFATWAIALLHAGIRPSLGAWREQGFAIAGLTALLVLVDMASVPFGDGPIDGVRMTVDIALVLVAAVFAAFGRGFARMVQDRERTLRRTGPAVGQ